LNFKQAGRVLVAALISPLIVEPNGSSTVVAPSMKEIADVVMTRISD
jgi:hypothetical protein